MSSNLQQTLLQAIRAAPEEDAPRLVYADWAEEQGDAPRAEFVRLQVQRARLPWWDAEGVRLELKERALLAAHEERWRAALPALEGVIWGSFRRGFVEKLALAGLDTLRTHQQELQRHVSLESIALRWPSEEEWDQTGPVEGIRELTVYGTLLSKKDMDGLARSRLLSSVRALNLVESEMKQHSLRRLLASPHLRQLRALRIPHHTLSDLEELVTLDLPELAELDLSVATVEDLGSMGRDTSTLGLSAMKQLAAWPTLAHVRSLDLSGNQLDARGLRVLLASPHVAGLRELHVRGISERYTLAMDAFRKAAPGLQLDALSLEGGIDNTGAAQLAKAPCLSDLKALELRYFFEREEGAFARLAQAPWFAGLRLLDASEGHVAGLLSPLVTSGPTRLHTLKLASSYYRSVEADDMEALAHSPALAGLLHLDLSYNEAGEELIEPLAEAQGLQALQILRLRDHHDLDASLRELIANSPLAQRLTSLELGESKETPARLPQPRPRRLSRSGYHGRLYDL